jgi:hypothetical protein
MSALSSANVKLQLAARGTDGSRTATLVRRDTHEVRLVEPSQAPSANTFLFWVELFDHSRQGSIDSIGCHVLAEAAIAAEHLIAQVEAHDNNSKQSSRSHAPRFSFLHSGLAHARCRSVGLDRCS